MLIILPILKHFEPKINEKTIQEYSIPTDIYMNVGQTSDKTIKLEGGVSKSIELNMADCLELALINNPKIRAAYAKSEMAKYQKWETLYEYDRWFFPKDMFRHKDPIVKWIEVDLHQLGIALEKTYSTEVLQLVNQTKNPFEFYDIDNGYCACEIPEKLDSIWSELQADLSIVINEGNIKKMH